MSILENLGLSPDAILARKTCIGGSDANTIMSGKDDRILNLWREKRGEAEGDDLSDILAVQMGSFTEPLNIAWFEKQTGDTVTNAGEIAQHETIPFMRATLDGKVRHAFGGTSVFEAKHTGTRSSDAELFERYVPQLTHNCLCAGEKTAVLSAFKGNGDWAMFEYEMDAEYAAAVLHVEARFWDCVKTGEPPVPLPLPPMPKPKGVIEYDKTGDNQWAAAVADYQETELAADRHELAKKTIKGLVPADASKCFGHGIELRRDKRGALRFYTQKENLDERYCSN